MNPPDLNKDVRTQINPEDEVKAAPKSGYTQVKDLMDTVHGYCMDYTKASFNFIHENKVAAASVSIAKIISDSQK